MAEARGATIGSEAIRRAPSGPIYDLEVMARHVQAILPRHNGGIMDVRLVVYGTNKLRLVDASVFPLIPRRNIISTVYAVAEKAADIFRGLGMEIMLEWTDYLVNCCKIKTFATLISKHCHLSVSFGSRTGYSIMTFVFIRGEYPIITTDFNANVRLKANFINHYTRCILYYNRIYLP